LSKPKLIKSCRTVEEEMESDARVKDNLYIQMQYVYWQKWLMIGTAATVHRSALPVNV
jgi:hypothetical protein